MSRGASTGCSPCSGWSRRWGVVAARQSAMGGEGVHALPARRVRTGPCSGDAEDDLLAGRRVSIYRVTAGLLLSAGDRAALGLLIGTFRPVQALLEPLTDFIRYMPAVAFIPLVMLWVGIDEGSKIAIIFIGTFFQMVLMVAEDVRRVPAAQIEAAQTMGANAGRDHREGDAASPPSRRCSTPCASPWAGPGPIWWWRSWWPRTRAWATRSCKAQRFLQTDKIFAGIIVIGLIGLVTDQLFRLAHRKAFPWLYLKVVTMSDPKIAIRGLGKRFGDGAHQVERAGGHRPRHRRQRVRHLRRRFGLRQVHAAAHHRRAGVPHRRRAAGGRPAGDRPGHRPRHGVPALQPLPVADGDREHQVLPPARGAHREDRTSADVEAASGRADALLSLMGLSDVPPAPIPTSSRAACSSGWRSRARSWAGPTILLMDEPFGALDAQTREVMHDLIRHVHKLEKRTIVFVTHDVEEAHLPRPAAWC